jgi:hypothetical protein
VIDYAKKNYALQPIAIYLNKADQIYYRTFYPELISSDIIEHLCWQDFEVAELARYLQKKYKILGVVPYFEQSVAPMAYLADALGLDWNPLATLLRFRNKFELKAHLRKQDPTLELGAFRRIEKPTELFSEPVPEKFILKPLSGFANAAIGFFHDKSCSADIAKYMESQTGTLILEEQFIGDEYAVNGQMDAEGHPIVVNITRYVRREANGKPNQYHYTIHVPRKHPAFATLEDYAKRVMLATGLRRCPFHLETILTDAGPRLVEVAARFGGLHYAFLAEDVHDQQLDYLGLGTHYYLFKTPYPHTTSNWTYYDQIQAVHVDGISHQKGWIYKVEGREHIERLPQFRGWVREPYIGARLHITQDLYSVPFSFNLRDIGTEEALLNLAHKIEFEWLKINQHVQLQDRLLVHLKEKARQLQFRVLLGQNRLWGLYQSLKKRMMPTH